MRNLLSGIPKIDKPRNNCPGLLIIFVFSSICFPDRPKNFTPTADMFDLTSFYPGSRSALTGIFKNQSFPLQQEIFRKGVYFIPDP